VYLSYPGASIVPIGQKSLVLIYVQQDPVVDLKWAKHIHDGHVWESERCVCLKLILGLSNLSVSSSLVHFLPPRLDRCEFSAHSQNKYRLSAVLDCCVDM
jgi:hypothetical protein